jgi:hypothetical protein
MTLLSALRGIGPWFQRWPRGSIVVAVLLYAVIFALRLTSSDASDATTMFFVLPIALVAVAFGRVAGLAAGLSAVGLVVAWTVVDHVALSPTGWATRVVPLLLLGSLLGGAADRLRRAEAERARLEVEARWHRQAVEINDSIVQALAVAKWSLEGGDLAAALATVTDALDHAHRVVSELIRDAGLQPGGRFAPGAPAELGPGPAGGPRR